MRVADALLTVLLTACPASSTATLSDGPAGQLSADARGSGDAGIGTSSLGIYASGSRLKMRVLVSGDGAKAFLGWHDEQRNEDCDFFMAGDGQRRCLPGNSSVVASAYFSDGGCTRPLAVDNRPCQEAAPPYGLFYQGAFGALCPTQRLAIWSVGGPHVGDVFQSDGHGGCLKTSIGGLLLWTLTAEVPPSNFQSATEQIVD